MKIQNKKYIFFVLPILLSALFFYSMQIFHKFLKINYIFEGNIEQNLKNIELTVYDNNWDFNSVGWRVIRGQFKFEVDESIFLSLMKTHGFIEGDEYKSKGVPYVFELDELEVDTLKNPWWNLPKCKAKYVYKKSWRHDGLIVLNWFPPDIVYGQIVLGE